MTSSDEKQRMRPSRVRAWSLRSIRAWVELDRYLATELGFSSVASRVRAQSLRSDRAWLVRGPMAILELVRGRFGYVSVASGQLVFSGSIEIRTRFYCKTNCGLPFSRQVIGAVVAQLFWLCMKAVLSFIAKDVVGKGLNHGTFVLTPKPWQDLGLLLVLGGAMTNSAYVSRYSFNLIPYRFKVRDRLVSLLYAAFRARNVRGLEDVMRYCKGFSLNPAFEKHFRLSTDVRSQNCCSCLDLISDRGVRTKGSRKFLPGKRHPPTLCFVSCQVIGAVVAQLFSLCMKAVLSFIAKDVVGMPNSGSGFTGRCSTPRAKGRLSRLIGQVSRSFHVLRWPMGVENDLFFRETKPKSLDPEPVQSQFRDFTGRISALISIFGEISLESLMEFYERFSKRMIAIRGAV
ncbi:hypothetical protein F2Q69_00029593 [Brassica cretica]|uniref:Uncharacterized protein n=1 Tax=Brassica cretica TaxID=69181 RepID=A0A8S9RQZ4_BRACR|nr:hypothetical protein F2Q69_00029593 [Brassica cretica]